MAQDSKIGWCDDTGNLWHGCTECSSGCNNCYARILSERWKRDIWGNDKPRMAIKSVWNDLKKFNKLAGEQGKIRRVFVGSMMDIFEKPMPLIDSKGNKIFLDDMDEVGMHTSDLRDTFFGNISRGDYPNLQFLLLTKRPGNINKYIPKRWLENPPENVMYGCSIPDQKSADTLLPQFLKVKGRKFLSMEPLLGPIEPLFTLQGPMEHLKFYWPNKRYTPLEATIQSPGIDWVIVGGESGRDLKKLRLMHPQWVRDIRDNCAAAGVPFFFKQWGEYYTNRVLISEKRPVFQEFKSMQHWIDKAQTWVKGGRCISIDGTECKNGSDFEKCNYPVVILDHVGTKKSGNILDGKIYEEF